MQRVSQFKYVGFTTSSDEICDTEMKRRISTAKKTFQNDNDVLEQRHDAGNQDPCSEGHTSGKCYYTDAKIGLSRVSCSKDGGNSNVVREGNTFKYNEKRQMQTRKC